MANTSQEANTSLTQANIAPSGDTRPVYEIGYHLVPTVAEDGVAAEVAKILGVLGDAEIIKDEAPRKIHFAYQIERAGAGRREKYTEGYFGFIKFAIDKEFIAGIEDAVRANKTILRYLLVQTTRDEVAPARRAVFASDRLEGETLKKPTPLVEEVKAAEVSEEELDKSIDAIVL